MNKWFRNKKNILSLIFIIPILLVAIVSISHVQLWYGITNPMMWATYLSLGIEIAGLAALAGFSIGMRKFVLFPFGIVLVLQFIGNIFYAFQYIDVSSALFKSWVDFISPIFSMMGIDPSDVSSYKRIMAFVSGGFLPLISLTFLHLLIKTQDVKVEDVSSPPEISGEPPTLPSPAQISEEQLDRLSKILVPQPTTSLVLSNGETPQVSVDRVIQAERAAKVVSPTPSVSSTMTPTPTNTPSSSGQVQSSPTPTPSATPTLTATVTKTASPTATPTHTSSPTPSGSATPTPTPTASVSGVQNISGETAYNSPFTRAGSVLKKFKS